jgi:hypothetical protein
VGDIDGALAALSRAAERGVPEAAKNLEVVRRNARQRR